jgi:hypothetical protein
MHYNGWIVCLIGSIGISQKSSVSSINLAPKKIVVNSVP